MRIFLNVMIFLTAMLITMAVTIAFASDKMLACTQADGTVLYTNKDVKGCKTVVGPELSVVPSYPQNPQDRTLESTKTYELPVPPAVKDASSPINDRLCTLYNEWMLINGETDGGMHFKDATQKTRYNALWRTFSSGFISVDCRL